mgnify:CR=1 FL=1
MMYTYTATVVRIVDGDTLVLLFDLGFHIYHETRVRLRGVNCPERFTPEGKASTAFLHTVCPVGTVCSVATIKDTTDKYGRYVAVISVAKGDVSSLLIEHGHGLALAGRSD